MWQYSAFSRYLAPLSHTSPRAKRSYENVLLHVHFHVDQTHFHTKSFARGLVLKQRHKVTRNWRIIAVLNSLETCPLTVHGGLD